MDQGQSKPDRQRRKARGRLAVRRAHDDEQERRREDEFGDKSVQRLYGGMPNPTVVIDVDGKIALKMAWTGGEELDRYLERFLAGGGRFVAELRTVIF